MTARKARTQDKKQIPKGNDRKKGKNNCKGKRSDHGG